MPNATEEDDLDSMDSTPEIAGEAPEGWSSPNAGVSPIPASPAAPPLPPRATPGVGLTPPTPDQWWIPQPSHAAEDAFAQQQRQATIDLFKHAPAAQAMKAMEMANRLEGLLGFEADRKAGVPVMESLQKWAPKLYFAHPQALTGLYKQAAAMNQPGFEPTVKNVGGVDYTQVSPRRWAPLPKPPSSEAKTIKDEGGQVVGHMVGQHFVPIPKTGPDEAAKTEQRILTEEAASIHKQMASGGMRKSDLEAAQAHLENINQTRRAIAKGKAANIKEHREEGLALIKKHPSKAAAIRKHFEDTYGEALE